MVSLYVCDFAQGFAPRPHLYALLRIIGWTQTRDVPTEEHWDLGGIVYPRRVSPSTVPVFYPLSAAPFGVGWHGHILSIPSEVGEPFSLTIFLWLPVCGGFGQARGISTRTYRPTSIVRYVRTPYVCFPYLEISFCGSMPAQHRAATRLLLPPAHVPRERRRSLFVRCRRRRARRCRRRRAPAGHADSFLARLTRASD